MNINIKFIPFLFLLTLQLMQAQNQIILQERAGVARAFEAVTLGIPFEQGALNNLDQLSIGNNGTRIPAQFSIMSYWPNATIKWVKADFIGNANANQKSSNYFIYTDGVNSFPSQEIEVSESNSTIVVNTGVLKFTINKENFNLFDEVSLDLNNDGTYANDELLVSPGSSEGAQVIRSNISYTSKMGTPQSISIEESGPLKVVINVVGSHTSETGNLLKYETRIYAYAGLSYVSVSHSYANNNSVESLGFSADESLGVQFQEYSLHLKVNLQENASLKLGGSGSQIHQLDLNQGSSISMTQKDRPSITTPFQYIIDNNQSQIAEGDRAKGWAIVSDSRVGIGVSSKYFWEKYPKGLTVSANGDITLKSVCDKTEMLLPGMGASDEYIIWFMNTEEVAQNLAQLPAMSNAPLVAHCQTDRYIQTKVFYDLSTCYLDQWPNLSNYINSTTSNHLLNREDLDLYGNLNFGDVPIDRWLVDDERIFSAWGNNYYDCSLTNSRLFVLTEDSRHWDIMESMTLHWMETDCWNTQEGDWLNGYCGAYSTRHRENANFNHHYGEGVFNYYYLTGNQRALEIGLRAANSIDQQQFWGNENVLLRGAYLRGSVSLEAYKATGEQRFLNRAKQQIDAIMNTQNQFGLVGNSLENATAIEGSQTFMMGLFSDLVYKYLLENFDQGLANQLIAMADFINQFGRTNPGTEDYYNFWNSPNDNLTNPDLEGSQDDFVYWNGKGLLAGLYAYAYFFSGEDRHRIFAEQLLDDIWGNSYLDAFGDEFWGKASSQAMKNVLNAASIICGDLTHTNRSTTPSQYIKAGRDVKIYPNPVSQNLFIEMNKVTVQDIQIELVDLRGKLLLSRIYPGGTTRFDIDLNQFVSGIYFIRLKTAQDLITSEKIIKH